MKTTGLIFLFFVAATASAQTNQDWSVCRHPIRVFSDHTKVNLTPLFQWWQRQPLPGTAATNVDAGTETERPLAAWQRITGVKTGELAGSWVVNAVLFTSPTTHTNARIFLNHPPAAEESAFYSLRTQLAEIGPQITNALRAYQTATNAAQKAEIQARKWRYSGSKQANENSNYQLRLAQEKREAAAAAQNRQKQLEAVRPQLQKQFDAIPAVNGKYHIDWFALALGRSKQGVLIYDLGEVPPTSP